MALDAYKSLRIRVTKSDREMAERSIEFVGQFTAFYTTITSRLEPFNPTSLCAALLDWIASSESEFEVFKTSLRDTLSVCAEIAQCDTSD